MNEELSPDIKEELEKNENLNNDKLDEESPKIVAHILKENDRTQIQPLETLKVEVEENEQIVQLFGNKVEQVEEVKKEAEKSPKGKGRRSKTKDRSVSTLLLLDHLKGYPTYFYFWSFFLSFYNSPIAISSSCNPSDNCLLKTDFLGASPVGSG